MRRFIPRFEGLGQCTSTTAPAASGASQAMVAGLDDLVVQMFWCNIPKFSRLSIPEMHSEHLVEVTVI